MGTSFVNCNATITITITNTTYASPITTNISTGNLVSIPALTAILSLIGLALLVLALLYVRARW
jgi:hypothetical protein